MNTIITLVQFFAALGLIVTLHELGHFLAARAFGIKVEKFYLFFDAFGDTAPKLTPRIVTSSPCCATLGVIE